MDRKQNNLLESFHLGTSLSGMEVCMTYLALALTGQRTTGMSFGWIQNNPHN